MLRSARRSMKAALVLVLLVLLIGSRAVRAQSIGVSGNPGLLRISVAIAGLLHRSTLWRLRTCCFRQHGC